MQAHLLGSWHPIYLYDSIASLTQPAWRIFHRKWRLALQTLLAACAGLLKVGPRGQIVPSPCSISTSAQAIFSSHQHVTGNPPLAGSALLLTHSSAVGQSLAQRALSRRGSRDLRCAALWALAGAAGLHASPDWLGSNPEAEAGLREAVFAAAQANVGDPSPAEVLLSFLHQPVEDLRVATYG